ASTIGTRSRSQRGTLASIRKAFSFRSTPPKGVKRSPARRGRTTNAVGSRSASNTTRPGSSGITNPSASESVASSVRPISGRASRPGTVTRRSVRGGNAPGARRRRGPLTPSVTAPIRHRCPGRGRRPRADSNGCVGHLRAIRLGEQRQELVTDPVSQEFPVLVGRILDPLEPGPPYLGDEVGVSALDQRADDPVADRRDSRESPHAGALENAHQHVLGMVVHYTA